jgi:peroxiredoxin (alkyl hydroperoxide reductase subunit C)
MAVEVGDTAPDFTLVDQDRQKVTLSSFRGEKNVLLVFIPFAFSGVCRGELCEVRDNIAQYRNERTEVVVVTVDSMFVHKAWADEEGFGFPMLADFWPHGETAKAYGVFNDVMGMAERGTFLVDKEGVVRFAETVEGPVARDQTAWRKAIAEVGA